MYDDSRKLIQKHIEDVRKIKDKWERWKLLVSMSITLAEHGRFEEAIYAAIDIIRFKSYIYNPLKSIANEFSKKTNHDKLKIVLFEALKVPIGIYDEAIQDLALMSIPIEYLKLGDLDRALDTAKIISKEKNSDFGLCLLSEELAKLGKFDQAIEISSIISDEIEREYAQESINIEFSKLCTYSEVEPSIPKLSHECTDFELLSICTDLASKGNYSEAFAIVHSIGDSFIQSEALSSVATEASLQGDMYTVERIAIQIPSTKHRHHTWRMIAKKMHEKKGALVSFDQGEKLSFDEASIFYKRGWTDFLVGKLTNQQLLEYTLPKLYTDSTSIEYLLNAYSLHHIFFETLERKKLQRLNSSLNIQWAFDIADKLPLRSGVNRLSTNLEVWIDEIPDEDDRDQVRLWAKQVFKGRMTEHHFSLSIEKLISMLK